MGEEIENIAISSSMAVPSSLPVSPFQDTRTTNGLVISNALADTAVTDACFLQ